MEPPWMGGLSANSTSIVAQGPLQIFWADEKPPQEIYSELLARLTATGGHAMVSFTVIGNDSDGLVHKQFLSLALLRHSK